MFSRRRRGASLTPYGLIVGLVAVTALLAVENVGSSISRLFGGAADTLGDAVSGTGGGTGNEGEGEEDEETGPPNTAPHLASGNTFDAGPGGQTGQNVTGLVLALFTDDEGNTPLGIASASAADGSCITAVSAALGTLTIDTDNANCTGSFEVVVADSLSEASASTLVQATVALTGDLMVTSASDSGADATIDGTLSVDANDGGGLSLREAVSHAAGGDIIGFDQTAMGGSVITLASPITLTGKSVTLLGEGVTLGGGNTTRHFTLVGSAHLGAVEVSFINGKAPGTGYPGGYGGSILVQSGTIDFDRCVFSNNATASSSFVGGGAIYLFASGTGSSITNSTFSGNTGRPGGAIMVDTGPLTISGSLFQNNANVYAAEDGGAIWTDHSIEINNSTFVGNTSARHGGAAYIFLNSGATYKFYGNTVTGNTASASGGGFHFRSNDASIVTGFSNNILAGNSAASSRDAYGDNSPVPTISGTNNLFEDVPNFGLANMTNTTTATAASIFGGASPANNGGYSNTISIANGGPAHDTGDNAAAAALSTDQRGPGFARVVGGTVDIGAFERQ
jgi:Flp pilus assembly pilin Flp